MQWIAQQISDLWFVCLNNLWSCLIFHNVYNLSYYYDKIFIIECSPNVIIDIYVQFVCITFYCNKNTGIFWNDTHLYFINPDILIFIYVSVECIYIYSTRHAGAWKEQHQKIFKLQKKKKNWYFCFCFAKIQNFECVQKNYRPNHRPFWQISWPF